MSDAAVTKPRKAVRHSPMEHPRRQYPQETAALQAIAQSCGLVEKIKWGKPCFMLGSKNILLIQRFNHYIAMLFFKGSLMKDPGGKLFRVGETMQAPRQLRFTSVDEIEHQQSLIQAFIHQAIDLETAGAKVERTPVAQIDMPAELETALHADPALRKAFAALTPGRQKGYLYQIASARQSATRSSRIKKFTPRILAGKGWND